MVRFIRSLMESSKVTKRAAQNYKQVVINLKPTAIVRLPYTIPHKEVASQRDFKRALSRRLNEVIVILLRIRATQSKPF
jgi:hypothetical protein